MSPTPGGLAAQGAPAPVIGIRDIAVLAAAKFFEREARSEEFGGCRHPDVEGSCPPCILERMEKSIEEAIREKTDVKADVR